MYRLVHTRLFSACSVARTHCCLLFGSAAAALPRFSAELLFPASQTPDYVIAGEHRKSFAFVLVEFQKVDGDALLDTISVTE